ncbi:MAG: hypothetical protein MUC94_00680 [bacterium]|nr:hypothetical protein [bacterium]
MRKICIIILLLFVLAEMAYPQANGGMIKTGIVLQKWTIDGVQDPISEGTFPIELIYPVRENFNLQVSHSPALSRFGSSNLSGLSDTWVRSTYSLPDNRTMLSVGVGLPTGKTDLNNSEMGITALLSQNAFKFRLPVFGQGLTISAGAMYAYPVNDQLTFGTGINYVFRGNYKFSQSQADKFNPGDQIGLNAGLDYLITPKLRTNIDFILNYYTADKLGSTEIFASGPKLTAKAGFQYQVPFGLLWLRSFYRYKAKNESWDGQSLVPESKNTNITQREIELGGKIPLSDILMLMINGEIRSYVENEVGDGWVDLAGLGFGYELLISEKFALSMAFKVFFGDGNFNNVNPTMTGTEFHIGTQWNF